MVEICFDFKLVGYLYDPCVIVKVNADYRCYQNKKKDKEQRRDENGSVIRQSVQDDTWLSIVLTLAKLIGNNIKLNSYPNPLRSRY